MQNIKYHTINTASMLFFSFVLASTITQVYRFSAVPTVVPTQAPRHGQRPARRVQTFNDYRTIIDSTFFRVASASGEGPQGLALQSGPAVSDTDLQLMGTISGPWQIARALIKKKSEPEAKIYKIGSDVFGFRVTSIYTSKVHLKMGKDIRILDLYEDKAKEQAKPGQPLQAAAPGGRNSVKQNLSRSELQQKVFKNMDTALQGMRAGPYRVDGKVEGYKIFRIRPYNILYKLGARPGDIIKRVNGHPINSTEKLYQLWESVKTDSRITVDLERNRQQLNYEFNITD
jgi:general secretion pathway protein C